EQIQLRTFETEEEEASGIAREIAHRDRWVWGQVTVLARTRALLQRIHEALREHDVPSVIAQRRDDFLSAEFRWFVATLRQVTRPLDRRNIVVMIDSFNRMTQIDIAADQVVTDAEATGQTYLAIWLQAVKEENLDAADARLIELLVPVVNEPASAKGAIDAFLAEFAERQDTLGAESDLAEDMAAWRELSRDIGIHIGRKAPLDQFLQELQLRSKEPTPQPETVTLITIHGAKGREFDFVYVIGLAEDIIPSYQSRQKGDHSPEMEEERRNCFVAITRTKECLVLSRAREYRGWPKQASRFLTEMELAN
ncbi:MAG: 3'-5' exonuclease, partial [Gemmatimonadota bacterium]